MTATSNRDTRPSIDGHNRNHPTSAAERATSSTHRPRSTQYNPYVDGMECDRLDEIEAEKDREFTVNYNKWLDEKDSKEELYQKTRGITKARVWSM